jgi:hypothetical protein
VSCKVVPTSDFAKDVKRLAKKYKSMRDDLQEFLGSIAANPLQGVDLGGGIRKVRIAIKSKDKGKSGGARVITYNVLTQEREGVVYLITLYDKSEVSTVEISIIKEMIRSLE